MIHTITVVMPVEVTFTIDDTKMSDWDGRDLMHVHENGERWSSGQPIERDLALAYMAAQMIVGGRVAGEDGWADFPDDATSIGRWTTFEFRDADVMVESKEAE